jgi:hypothetical protein
MLTIQTTTTTPPRRQVGHGQLRKERATSVSPRPHPPGAKGRPPDPLSGPLYAHTPTRSLAPKNVIRRQPMQIGPLANFVSGRGIDPALEQLRRQRR